MGRAFRGDWVACEMGCRVLDLEDDAEKAPLSRPVVNWVQPAFVTSAGRDGTKAGAFASIDRPENAGEREVAVAIAGSHPQNDTFASSTCE